MINSISTVNSKTKITIPHYFIYEIDNLVDCKIPSIKNNLGHR